MLAQFYNSIIDDEKRMFNVKDETLKIAARDVAKTYSSSALRKGSTFLEYNLPQNRCAYLFKYAPLHTDLVFKYFKLLMKNESLKAVLDYKKDLKVCCLGGGPGTDVVGLFKAIALFPSFHQKVSQVTVLDLCGGWRNSFKHIISRMKHGKVEGIPAKFVDSNNFIANLIAVDLLGSIPDNVLKVITSADIVCMVKFVSAIQGKPECNNALKVIGEKLKLGSIVLFIDNYSNLVFKSLEKISSEVGLFTILGPLHVKHKHSSSKSKTNLYGCSPLSYTQVSVIGSVKISNLNLPPLVNSNALLHTECSYDNEDKWDTESESEEICIDHLLPNKVKKNSRNDKNSERIPKISFDKFTQTEEKYFNKCKQQTNDSSLLNEIFELPSLIEALSDLVKVMKILESTNKKKQCCCCNGTQIV